MIKLWLHVFQIHIKLIKRRKYEEILVAKRAVEKRIYKEMLQLNFNFFLRKLKISKWKALVLPLKRLLCRSVKNVLFSTTMWRFATGHPSG